MSKLYPIGTQLITRRLSQVALYEELINLNEIYSFLGEKWIKGFYREATKWRVTVTPENQKWLSPAPLGDDLAEIELIYSNGEVGEIYYQTLCDSLSLDDPRERISKIEKRTYPNGQRAPMIEWDEVILPTMDKLS